jgi:hypothetical protein
MRVIASQHYKLILVISLPTGANRSKVNTITFITGKILRRYGWGEWPFTLVMVCCTSEKEKKHETSSCVVTDVLLTRKYNHDLLHSCLQALHYYYDAAVAN